MSNFTYLVKEGYHESEEDSEDSSIDKSTECNSTDVEEVDAQRSSDKQSTSAKVSCCVHFPYIFHCLLHLQSHSHGPIASASDTVHAVESSENTATAEVNPVKILYYVA